MARISTYTEDIVLTGDDKIIGTDADGNVTKNFTLDSILGFIELNSSTATAPVIDGGTGLATGDQIYDFVTGQNYLTGNETITLLGDLSGSGTTSIDVTIASAAVEASMLNGNVISGQAGLLSGVGGSDELLISNSGAVKKTDIGALQTYMQNNLTFTSNTDTDVNVANLTARLPEITENVTIGDAPDVTITTSGDLIATGDLNVSGNTQLGNATTDTVDIAGNLDVAGNAVIAGNLTVSGTTTSVNSNTVNIGDNIIVLNAGETSAPTQDAGIEVERGTSTNRSLIWDESAGNWKIQDINGDYQRIATYADSVEDVTVTTGVDDGLAVTPTLSGTDNRVKEYNVAIDFTQFQYKTSIGDGLNLAYPVTHNLGSLDVIVQLYDNLTYDTVYADVVRNSTNQITVTFANAPSTNDIRVLVYKL